MTYSLWRVLPNGDLTPADDTAAGLKARRKPGAHVRADMSEMRSPSQLRMYWALITKAWENQDAYATKEDLSAAALCHIGHCYRVQGKGGVVIERAKSIAFGNLPAEEFNQIFNAVSDLLATTLGVTTDSLRGEAAESPLDKYLRA